MVDCGSPPRRPTCAMNLLFTLWLHYRARDVYAAYLVLGPFVSYLAHLVGSVLGAIIHSVWLFLDAYGAGILLALELLICSLALPWLAHHCGWYSEPEPAIFLPLTRAQRRHPVCNVFIRGLSAKGVLLRKLSLLDHIPSQSHSVFKMSLLLQRRLGSGTSSTADITAPHPGSAFLIHCYSIPGMARRRDSCFATSTSSALGCATTRQ